VHPRPPSKPPRLHPLLRPSVLGLGLFYLATAVLLFRLFVHVHWGVAQAIVAAALCALIALIFPVLLLSIFESPPPRSSRGRTCVECGYPRDGLTDDAPCPECGTTRWRGAHDLQETLDDAAIQDLLSKRVAALDRLLQELKGRSITRVYYVELELQGVEELRELHLVDIGVEFTLDDGSLFHAEATSPPFYFLSLGREPINYIRRDFSSHPAWTRFLNLPITRIDICRQPMPMDILHETTVLVDVPVDAIFTLGDEEVLVLSASGYEPGPPETLWPGRDMTMVVFGSARATELGFKPPHRDP
jgi:hypothetical protein